MLGPVRCGLIAALVAACGSDASTKMPDAAIGGGFVIAWDATPAMWPSSVSDGVMLERAALAVDTLRVVGDAAPGDPRTTSSELTLQWAATGQPTELALPDAPGGLYSQLSLLVDGHVAGPSIEIDGHVTIDAVDHEYRIVDDSPFSITLDIHTTLTPPTPARIALAFDFAAAVAAVDFSEFEDVGGRLELMTGDPEMTVFRSALTAAIRATP